MISGLAEQGRQRAGAARIDAVSIWQNVMAHFEQLERHLLDESAGARSARFRLDQALALMREAASYPKRVLAVPAPNALIMAFG